MGQSSQLPFGEGEGEEGGGKEGRRERRDGGGKEGGRERRDGGMEGGSQGSGYTYEELSNIW